MDRGAWRATIHGVTKSQTRLSDFHCPCTQLSLDEEAGIQSFSTCTFYYRNIGEGLKKAKEELWRRPLQTLTQILLVLLLTETFWPCLWADRGYSSKDSTPYPPNRQSRNTEVSPEARPTSWEMEDS